ncbi:MBL fold metallo-hydrolase [Alkalibacillus silvisoli]|uniref:MBL fold metallo-hydrolase n=1 Tax=Alkalibacillus silvisoli TaxID=392823 RepID=A0ABP3JEJ1_9BACI
MRVQVGLIVALLGFIFLSACEEQEPSSEPIGEIEEVEESQLEQREEVEEDSVVENGSAEEVEVDSVDENGSEEESENSEESLQSQLEVYYFDVGQADSTLLKYEHEEDLYRILIDTGDWISSDVTYYLNDLEIDVIDLVIGTHIHADHIGQMDEVIENFEVDEVWMTGNEGTSETYEQAITAIETSDVDYHEPRKGEEYDIGPLEVDVVHPNELTGDYNEDSISTKMTYGDVSFLFTGDAEEGAEASMLQAGHELDADVLKLGHHGSSSSTGSQFLEAVDPNIAIYSAGANNSYGHPHSEVVERVKNANIDLYGTDVHGTVTVTTDGEDLNVETQHNGTIEVENTEEQETNETEEEAANSDSKEGCVDLNSASTDELQAIIHIGPERAQEIMDLRPFDSVSELTRVHGIGDGRLGDIKSEGVACVGG